MNRDVANVVAGIASVALIAYATRWMSGRAAGERPKRSAAGNIYPIRSRIRVTGYVAAAVCVGIAIFALRDDSRNAAELFGAFALLAVWFATGNVSLTNTAITKRTLMTSQTLRWDEVSKVIVHKRDGGAVELRAGSKKLIVDMRFVAPNELLAEVEQHTSLQPVRD